MVEPDFWEVGASAAATTARRSSTCSRSGTGRHDDPWETSDFQCRELAPDAFS
jgi:hypothetical protein